MHAAYSRILRVRWVLPLALASYTSSFTFASDWIDDLRPIGADDWNYERAAHLIERAGFGGTPDEIRQLASLPPEKAVTRIVDYESVDTSGLSEFQESDLWDPGMDPFPPSRAEAVRIARDQEHAIGVEVLPDGESRRIQPVVDKFFYGLRANALETRRMALWWANRMVTTPRPLEEKMTLFWHGHFATSESKVRDYRMLLAQNRMLRQRATGNFRDMLLGIMRDPAMLVYLDNGKNVKEHPNENFGRELIELFTMGIGNYSEKDIREASRAFTGWTNDVLAFRFNASHHDDGPKEFLNEQGNLGGEDIVRIVLEQRATSEFIASRIYRFFVRESPSDALKAALGTVLRENDYAIKPLLRTIFLSRDFYSPPSVATQIKSPVHFITSTYRKLGLRQAPTIPDFNLLVGRLGQSLFYPPNVAGWPGGRTWITPASLMDRSNAIHGILFPPQADEYGHPDRRMPAIYQRVADRLAQGMNITNATRSGDAGSSMLVDADEDYNTRYGGYRGYVLAFERIRLVPRHAAAFDLVSMVRAEGAETAAEAVEHFMVRFLRVPLAPDNRDRIVQHLEKQIMSSRLPEDSERLEQALRSTLYILLCAPEYQLG